MKSTKQTQKREYGPPNKRPRETTSFAKGRGAHWSMSNRSAGSSKSSGIRQAPTMPGQPGGNPIVSRRPANFSRPDPSKATKFDESKAKRILKRNAIAPITEDQASSREDYLKIQEDIAWARAVLPNFECGFTNQHDEPAYVEPLVETLFVEVKNTSPKRLHAQEEPPRFDSLDADDQIGTQQQVEPSASNRVRTHETPLRQFVKVARGRKIIGVIDNSHPDGKIPRNQWGWIQASMASVALEVLRNNPGLPPSCTDIGWFQGTTKLIACDNDRSALLYKEAITKIGEVYPGAQLEVIDVQDIPSRPWATAWLPETPSESRDILELMTTFNPELPTTDWKVIKAVRFREAAMEVIFQISHESILYLTRCDGQLSYGFNKIHMKYYRTPCEALSNLEAFAAAVDPPSDDEMEARDNFLNEDISGYLSSESDCGGSPHSV
ncbi:uncharacterized protein LOC115763687 [Drosophila novamexicana]|uniref:uncharacterized protein LOC115763687 n=1 Tax=Drosophila novamexicana TaxID=47314 RepID=UPI0011E5BC17|nr:uncharacterized protein LOC115763687 [Drosophila novamexicana]